MVIILQLQQIKLVNFAQVLIAIVNNARLYKVQLNARNVTALLHLNI